MDLCLLQWPRYPLCCRGLPPSAHLQPSCDCQVVGCAWDPDCGAPTMASEHKPWARTLWSWVECYGMWGLLERRGVCPGDGIWWQDWHIMVLQHPWLFNASSSRCAPPVPLSSPCFIQKCIQLHLVVEHVFEQCWVCAQPCVTHLNYEALLLPCLLLLQIPHQTTGSCNMPWSGPGHPLASIL